MKTYILEICTHENLNDSLSLQDWCHQLHHSWSIICILALQDPRMSELPGTSRYCLSQYPPAQAGSARVGCSGPCPITFQSISSTFLGKLLVFDCLHSNKSFLMFKWNFLYFRACPLLLVLPLGIAEKHLITLPLLPSSGIYSLSYTRGLNPYIHNMSS